MTGLDPSNTTFYDVLDVKPEATPEEIREAYLRAKAAYSKDSAALYTLVSGEEMRAMLLQIEEAYSVLSSVQRRREYDAHHGLLDPDDDYFREPPRSRAPTQKIISIDRVPPMESSRDADDLLVAPSTDYQSGSNARPQPGAQQPVASPFETSGSGDEASDLFGATPAPLPRHDPLPDRRQAPRTAPGTRGGHMAGNPAGNSMDAFQPTARAHQYASHASREGSAISEEIEREISSQTDWHGDFLRKIREAMNLSIEEISTTTKISKNYLLAIEDEDFVKLPAAVYVRGFVMQIAKLLKLPHEKVAAAYMERYKKLRV